MTGADIRAMSVVRTWFRRVGALAALCVLAWPAAAQLDAAPEWVVPDAEIVAEAERYLNALPTVRARFSQRNADGSVDRGEIWIWRPGLARVEYAPPTELLLVADGTWLVYFDAELDQVSHIPMGSGPFRYLLADPVTLGGEARITRVERGDGVLRITLEDRETPEDGSVTLVFDEAPLTLRQWIVVDAQGFRTAVSLQNTALGERFERDWFYFPESARRPDFRLSDRAG